MATVTLTPEAIAFVDRFIDASKPADWFLFVSWKKGNADNRRTPNGAVTWERAPDVGWIVEFGGHPLGTTPADEGTPIHRSVRLIVFEKSSTDPFPGGEVYVEDGSLKLRANK